MSPLHPLKSLSLLNEPDRHPAQAGWRRTAAALLAYALGLLLSMALARLPHATAPLWYANALGAMVLLSQPARHWPLLLGVLMGLLAVFNSLVGSPWDAGLRYLPGNGLEMLVGAALLRPHLGRLAQRLRPQDWCLALVLGALLPGLCGALIGALLLPAQTLRSPSTTALAWWTGSVAGAMAILPLGLLALLRRDLLRERLRQPEAWVAVLACLGAALLVCSVSSQPHVYLMLLLVLVGLTQGLLATALATWGVSMALSYVQGSGLMPLPVSISEWGAWMTFLPLAALLVPAQLIAVAVERLQEQERRVKEDFARMPLMAASLDAQLRLLAVSERLQRWLPAARPGVALVECLALPSGERGRVQTFLQGVGAEPEELRLGDQGSPTAPALRLRARLSQGEFGAQLHVVLEDLSEQQRMQEALSQSRNALESSHFDPLTGLLQRGPFFERAQQLLARQSGQSWALAFVDVDRLKQVNDHHGHAAGDCLLAQLGHGLQNVVRPGDLAGRIGGDEFALLLAGVDSALKPEGLSERLEQSLAAHIDFQGQALSLSVSVGVLVGCEPAPLIELLAAADAAMFMRKRAQARPGPAASGAGSAAAEPAA
ncbi:diguanylate cyclase (GGDEF)-like protein [Inhella inkyongensis]|uniref:Diguanylate cyclase (GGDEF)-like protein n=1 Tax=Inhella inkyongensis TaxID=392593 RepID=A0A840S3U3_9BURK|nr:GGDEF domain-containing protein [Inhella inkyongensis]MBB5205927.1 diguanylate cyclase (GGDEF)-like protein [Inhella inkyongensis]